MNVTTVRKISGPNPAQVVVASSELVQFDIASSFMKLCSCSLMGNGFRHTKKVAIGGKAKAVSSVWPGLKGDFKAATAS